MSNAPSRCHRPKPSSGGSSSAEGVETRHSYERRRWRRLQRCGAATEWKRTFARRFRQGRQRDRHCRTGASSCRCLPQPSVLGVLVTIQAVLLVGWWIWQVRGPRLARPARHRELRHDPAAVGRRAGGAHPRHALAPSEPRRGGSDVGSSPGRDSGIGFVKEKYRRTEKTKGGGEAEAERRKGDDRLRLSSVLRPSSSPPSRSPTEVPCRFMRDDSVPDGEERHIPIARRTS